MAGRKDDLPAFHAGVKGVAGTKSQLAPDWTGKDNLPLAGNAGLHGKNILPPWGLDPQDIGVGAIIPQRRVLTAGTL